MKIDFNSDFGESYGVWIMGDDVVMLVLVSSVNVVCGFYVGDLVGILVMLKVVVECGVVVGVYVFYLDLVGFGWCDMEIVSCDLCVVVIYQIGVLQGLVVVVGMCVCYVKLYGVFYNQVVKDVVLVNVICVVICIFNLELSLYGLVGSELIVVVCYVDFNVVEEVFVDCVYEVDGSLVVCSKFGVMIENDVDVIV